MELHDVSGLTSGGGDVRRAVGDISPVPHRAVEPIGRGLHSCTVQLNVSTFGRVIDKFQWQKRLQLSRIVDECKPLPIGGGQCGGPHLQLIGGPSEAAAQHHGGGAGRGRAPGAYARPLLAQCKRLVWDRGSF